VDKKAKKATKKKIVRREWTKENIKEIKAAFKAKTPVDKISKITSGRVGSLRQKALFAGYRLGHQR